MSKTKFVGLKINKSAIHQKIVESLDNGGNVS